MKTLHNLYFLLILLLLSTSACQKEAVDLGIDDEILPYLTNFAEEAAFRGVDIDLENFNLEAYFTDISEVGVVGQCQTFTDDSVDLLIEKDYWRRINTNKKEFLIFHELGHCILQRGHLDDGDENGFCVSMMQSGTGSCVDNYNANTRETYLDELFK
jgi:hypothetical protein